MELNVDLTKMKDKTQEWIPVGVGLLVGSGASSYNSRATKLRMLVVSWSV